LLRLPLLAAKARHSEITQHAGSKLQSRRPNPFDIQGAHPMRSLPRNSPQAAARLVALVMISDGHVCRSEFDGLAALNAEGRLRLQPGALPTTLHQLCEELLATSPAAATLAQTLEESVVHSLLDEVDDPALQRLVFELAMAATRADGHAAEGELSLLGTMIARWGLFDAGSIEPTTRVMARADRLGSAPAQAHAPGRGPQLHAQA
jgi:hypothetical protein